MKVVLVLDVDAIRRAHNTDPAQFVESMHRAVMNGRPNTIYASGMFAGTVAWKGPRDENVPISVVGLGGVLMEPQS